MSFFLSFDQQNTMIACCSDGTRPIIFKIDRID
ncbi:MAG: TIGR04076 family protein [Dorea sp.]|nr:TIGR04076 family protein [Dorea sp.]